MAYNSPRHHITIDKAHECLEYAQDNAGCHHCPHSTTLLQQWKLEVLEEIHNRNFDPNDPEESEM
jgi:hypothetical protein